MSNVRKTKESHTVRPGWEIRRETGTRTDPQKPSRLVPYGVL
jgi:hypothetical protein